MTIASETNKSGPYNGNGATTAFAGGFKIADETHVQVIATDATGVETVKTLTTHYTISGVGNPTFTVTMLVAPASGTKLTIIRDVPFTQELDLENQGAYYAEDVEAALDAAAARDQQLLEKISRAVVLPVSADSGDLDVLVFNINILGAVSADVSAVAAVAADVAIVADAVADVSAVAAVAADVSAVAAVAGTLSGAAATAAAIAADVILIDADRATIAADKAIIAADKATVAADKALVAADKASADADVVLTHADVVLTGADVVAAGASAALAQKWAAENEDVAVSGGQYSAKHWALKAAASAGGVIAAVASDVWGKVSTKIISVATMWAAAVEQTVTYHPSVALDFNTFINAKITLTGNITLAQPTNLTPGQSGCIRLIQDATGGRTVAFHSDYKFASGTDPTASTAANATDLLYYHVVGTGVIHASLNKAIA